MWARFQIQAVHIPTSLPACLCKERGPVLDRLAPLAAAVDVCVLVDRRHLWAQGSVHPSRLPDVHCSHCGGCVPKDPGHSGGVDGLVHPGCHLCLRHVSHHPINPHACCADSPARAVGKKGKKEKA